MTTGGSNHEHGDHRCGCVATPRHFRSTWGMNARRQRVQRHCRQSMVIFDALTRMVANILVARPGTVRAVDDSFGDVRRRMRAEAMKWRNADMLFEKLVNLI